MLNFRKIVATLAAVLFIVFAVAPVSAITSDNVTLRLSFWFGAEDLPAWQQGVDEYHKLHPNVNIVLESSPWSDYWTKLQTQVASDSQADIIGMVSMYAKYFVDNNALLNLSPYIARDGFDVQDFWPGMMKAYSDGKGGVYAFPYDMSTMLLMVNVDMFKKAGVVFNPKGYTMDEFVEVSKKLTKNGKYASFFYPNDSFSLTDLLWSAGVNPQGPDGNLKLNSPEAIKVIQWVADLGLKYRTNMRYSRATAGDFSQFFSQTAAIVSANPEWVMKARTNMPGVNIDVMPYPFVGRNGKKVTEGGSFAISEKTKYPDVAWDFLKYYTSSDALSRIVGATHRGIPGRISSKDTMLTSKLAVPHSRLFFDSLEGSKWFTYPKPTEIEPELGKALDLIYTGKATAKKALDDFQKRMLEIQSQ